MKQIILFLLCLLPFLGNSQTTQVSGMESIPDPKMKIGMIIYSNDPETVWNAFRFGNFAIGEGDSVKVFLLAKGLNASR